MTKFEDEALWQIISDAVKVLEADEEIVVCLMSVHRAVQKLYEAVRTVVPQPSLSAEEFCGIRSLILHAIADKRFFDSEMPTLTGFGSEEFHCIAEKLPRY